MTEKRPLEVDQAVKRIKGALGKEGPVSDLNLDPVIEGDKISAKGDKVDVEIKVKPKESK